MLTEQLEKLEKQTQYTTGKTLPPLALALHMSYCLSWLLLALHGPRLRSLIAQCTVQSLQTLNNWIFLYKWGCQAFWSPLNNWVKFKASAMVVLEIQLQIVAMVPMYIGLTVKCMFMIWFVICVYICQCLKIAKFNLCWLQNWKYILLLWWGIWLLFYTYRA